MTKQRLAEIMLELQEGANDIGDMGISVLFMLSEDGRVSTIGACAPIDVVFMVASMVRRIARDEGVGTELVIEGIREILQFAEEIGVQSEEI